MDDTVSVRTLVRLAGDIARQIELHLAAAEHLIAALDAMEGDPDLEEEQPEDEGLLES